MPYVSVHVDASDILEELSDSDIMAEVKRRKLGSGIGPNYSIPQKVATYTLEEAADILRKQERFDLAFKLEEIKVDFVGH